MLFKVLFTQGCMPCPSDICESQSHFSPSICSHPPRSCLIKSVRSIRGIRAIWRCAIILRVCIYGHASYMEENEDPKSYRWMQISEAQKSWDLSMSVLWEGVTVDKKTGRPLTNISAGYSVSKCEYVCYDCVPIMKSASSSSSRAGEDSREAEFTITSANRPSKTVAASSKSADGNRSILQLHGDDGDAIFFPPLDAGKP